MQWRHIGPSTSDFEAGTHVNQLLSNLQEKINNIDNTGPARPFDQNPFGQPIQLERYILQTGTRPTTEGQMNAVPLCNTFVGFGEGGEEELLIRFINFWPAFGLSCFPHTRIIIINNST